MKLVAWVPLLTDHQSHTLEALAAELGAPLVVRTFRAEHPDRASQGWINRHATTLKREPVPTRRFFRTILRWLQADADVVYLFVSPFEEWRIIVTLFIAVHLRRRIYLISEPYAPVAVSYFGSRLTLASRVRAALRPAVYRAYGRLVASRVAGLFAISRRAGRQYHENGVDVRRIHPFGYFVPRDDSAARGHQPRNTGELRVVYVGALIARKGLDVAVEAVALARRQGASVSLELYGPGDPAQFVRTSGVVHRGTIPFGDAQRVIATYDALLLPSRFDGWGVVVNEALLAGTPVICSDMVGAAALLERDGGGLVYPAMDAAALAAILTRLALNTREVAELRQAAGRAAERIAPAVAGRYAADVIRADSYGTAMPASPWYSAAPVA
jgi:Glycosyltransferase